MWRVAEGPIFLSLWTKLRMRGSLQQDCGGVVSVWIERQCEEVYTLILGKV